MSGRTSDVEAVSDESWLTTVEKLRSDRLKRPQDRADYVAAHLLVRLVAARVADREPSDIVIQQHCGRCRGNDHGKPSVRDLPDVRVSLSHTPGYVAAVADYDEVGVDVQSVSEVDWFDVSNTFITPGEMRAVRGESNRVTALAQIWARKEALIKLGELSLDSLKSIDATTCLIGNSKVWGAYVVDDWITAAHDMVGACISTRGVVHRRVGVKQHAATGIEGGSPTFKKA